MKKLIEFLAERGISSTVQRLKILKYIQENKEHPSIDMIYQKILKEIPTLSKTTIYNTMNLLVENGVVSKICVGEGEARYDINLQPHAHLRCIDCGNIYDVKIDPKLSRIKKINGNQIMHTNIYFTGKCKECL